MTTAAGRKVKVQMLNRDFCFLEFSKLITPQGLIQISMNQLHNLSQGVQIPGPSRDSSVGS